MSWQKAGNTWRKFWSTRSTAHVGPEVDNSRGGSKGVGTEYKRQSKSLLS